MTNFDMVKEFHDTYSRNTPAADEPYLIDEGHFELRMRLILEEVEELAEAYHNGDIIEVADALADLLYVTYGAADTFGIDADAVFAEVHRSNMTKLGANGKPLYRLDGKVMKGPNFEEPKIAEVLGL